MHSCSCERALQKAARFQFRQPCDDDGRPITSSLKTPAGTSWWSGPYPPIRSQRQSARSDYRRGSPRTGCETNLEPMSDGSRNDADSLKGDPRRVRPDCRPRRRARRARGRGGVEEWWRCHHGCEPGGGDRPTPSASSDAEARGRCGPGVADRRRDAGAACGRGRGPNRRGDPGCVLQPIDHSDLDGRLRRAWSVQNKQDVPGYSGSPPGRSGAAGRDHRFGAAQLHGDPTMIQGRRAMMWAPARSRSGRLKDA